MVSDKTKDIVATGAETVLAGIWVLLNTPGGCSGGLRVHVRHVAEVLARGSRAICRGLARVGG